jgi:hypothetical protein
MKCENCNTEITFLMALRQPTPFRFKCSKCKARYRVSAPYMKAITIGVIIVFATLTFGLWIGAKNFGIVFAGPFAVLMVGIWLMLEIWTCKYISTQGTLTRIVSTELGH